MKPPLNYMMLHNDTLADEFDAILGYRTSHGGIVLAASGGSPDPDLIALLWEDSASLLWEDGTTIDWES